MRGSSSRRLSELPIRTNFATFRVNHEPKNTASGDAAGKTAKPFGKRRAHGSARINRRIRNPGKQKRFLQFLEGAAQIIEDIARQKRLLALIAVENCELRCATA